MDVSAHIINIIADENKENLGRFYCNRETLDGMFQSLPEVEGYNLETNSNNDVQEIYSPNSPLGKTNLISDLHGGQKNEVNEDKQVNILCHRHCRCC